MEAFLFVLDSVIFVVMVYMGVRDAGRPEGTPASSLFRVRDAAAPTGRKPAVRKPAPPRRAGAAR